jgi:hypothetical protein
LEFQSRSIAAEAAPTVFVAPHAACALANPESRIPNPGSKASRQPAARRQESATSPACFRQILAAMRFSSMAHGLLLMGIAR